MKAPRIYMISGYNGQAAKSTDPQLMLIKCHAHMLTLLVLALAAGVDGTIMQQAECLAERVGLFRERRPTRSPSIDKSTQRHGFKHAVEGKVQVLDQYLRLCSRTNSRSRLRSSRGSAGRLSASSTATGTGILLEGPDPCSAVEGAPEAGC